MIKKSFILHLVFLFFLFSIPLVVAIGPGNPPVFNSISGGGIETPDNDLVFQMTFDEYNLTHFFDRSRFGNNGTMVNGINRTYGKNGWAAKFDGINDYMTVPDSSAFDLLNFSVSAWIKIDGSATSDRRVISQQAGDYWILHINSNRFAPWLSRDGLTGTAYGPSLNDGNWHMLLFTRDTVNDNVTLWVDGVVVGTVATTNNVAYTLAANVLIGTHNGAEQFFPGSIDEIQIYSRSLSANEVFSLYSKQKSSFSNIADTDDLVVGLESFSDSDDNTTFTQIDWYKNGVLNATTGAPNDTGLVLFMTFDERNKSYDYSPFKNNGTQVGGVDFSNDSAMGLGSFTFDGSDDYVTTADIDLLSNFTISAWFNVLNANDYRAIVSKESASADWNYRMFVELTTGKLVVDIRDQSANTPTVSTAGSVVGGWHLGVFVRDTVTDRIYLYLDGIMIGNASDTTVGNEDTNQLTRIGASMTGASNPDHPFIGSIDEVRIYNRSLSAEEINQLYRATAKKGFILNSSYTSENDVWRADVTLWDLYNRSETKSNYYFIKPYNDMFCHFVESSTCPTGTTKLIGAKNDSGQYNNAHAENYSNTNYNNSLCCSTSNSSIILGNACDEATVIRLNLTTNSHIESGNRSAYSIQACLNSTYKRVSCSYPTPFCSSSSCVLSMASSEPDNNTNAHVSDCGEYSQKVCCSLANAPPSKPTLVYPQNNNNTFFDRRVNFTWSASTDPEGDAITYNLNATCGAGCGCSNVYQTGISGINYTPSITFCKDVVYNWTVSACDVYGDCNMSTQFNFTILSVTDFILIVNATTFGAMAQNQNNDTSDDTPNPLVGRNNGNVLINATMNATSLFVSVPLNTEYFMFKSSDNESGSINSVCSQTAYANFTPLKRNVFCNLSFFDTFDEVRIDLNITIPSSESSGFKSSDIEITPVISE